MRRTIPLKRVLVKYSKKSVRIGEGQDGAVIPGPFFEVEAVADQKVVVDLFSDILHRYVRHPFLMLVEQGCDLQACRARLSTNKNRLAFRAMLDK